MLTILAMFALQDVTAPRTKVCADGSVLLATEYCREDVVELTCALRAYAAQTPSHVTIRLEPGAGRAWVTYRSMNWPEKKGTVIVRPDVFYVTTASLPNGTLPRLTIDRTRLTVEESAHAPMIGTTMTRDGICTVIPARP